MEEPEAFKLLEMARDSYKKVGTIFNRVKAESGAGKHIQTIQRERSSFPSFWDNMIMVLVYLAALITAEMVTAGWSMELGFVMYTGILLALLFHASLIRDEKFSYLLMSMMALPVLGMVGLSLPIKVQDPLIWFLASAVFLLGASYAIIKVQELRPEEVGLKLGNPKVQILIALSGVLLGGVEYLILKPAPLISSFTLEWVLLGTSILLISSGLAEELLFRGIIQGNAEKVFGNAYGLLFAALVFTAMHLVWNSILDLVFVFAVAVFYGYAFQKTRSISGVTFSHGIANTFLFLVLPFLLG
ncbi:CPBP family intramembrane glutamic endopeptidase [Methanobacterium aggregans]|uniref:CPBP family intramembrane glutamic endopeptidase n=1 Tax=Methanobacterium aggregans TaxID=1615586 RepID=UPI001FD8A3A0|nr:CPBP family intramembrane glutamic endopeptidase [Methanobacterium aggregans]MBP2047063.1 membrane protease YdiL (CAAX protease family) [Methanobacterium aggregans]